MKTAKLLTAITISVLLNLPSASAQEDIVEGKWTENTQWCSDKSAGATITSKSYEEHEFRCLFEGGDMSDPRHWIMKGRCEEAGEYEDGSTPPLVQIDLEVNTGVLAVKIYDNKYKPWSFAIKCP